MLLFFADLFVVKNFVFCSVQSSDFFWNSSIQIRPNTFCSEIEIPKTMALQRFQIFFKNLIFWEFQEFCFLNFYFRTKCVGDILRTIWVESRTLNRTLGTLETLENEILKKRWKFWVAIFPAIDRNYF